MIHVTPKGMVQPCAELEPVAHYSEFLPGSYKGPKLRKVLRRLPLRATGAAHRAPPRELAGLW